jgi:hypothetical protein
MLILSQLLIIAYAIASALQEVPVIKMARDYVPHGNPYSQPFHLWGWIMTAIVGNILAILQPSFGEALLSLLLSALWYWLLFDVVVSKAVHDTLFYVGDTSDVDKIIKKGATVKIFRWKIKIPGLGKYAGQIKAGVCLLLIIALNILYYYE